MEITEERFFVEQSVEKKIRKLYQNGREEILKEVLLTEHEIEIFVNNVSVGKAVCTPSDLAELTLGYLLSEGFIEGPDEIGSVRICDKGRKAQVLLKECTRNPGMVFAVEKKQMKPVEPVSWNGEQIFLFKDVFSEDMTLRRTTRSVHGCAMMIDGKLVFRCEDLGRHNALDKAVGHALRYGYNLKKAMVCITGRVPLDMAEKAVRSGIPVLISKRKPTEEAFLFAGQYGLTLICASGEDAIEIFCDAKM